MRASTVKDALGRGLFRHKVPFGNALKGFFLGVPERGSLGLGLSGVWSWSWWLTVLGSTPAIVLGHPSR